MTISRKGIFTDGGVPCELAAALRVAQGKQAEFTGFNKLAARTANQGECQLCAAGGIPLGAFVDCSPKGDTGTVETKGFEIIDTDGAYVVGDVLTTGAGGVLTALAGANPTLSELTAGCWQVDTVISATQVLIQLDARL